MGGCEAICLHLGPFRELPELASIGRTAFGEGAGPLIETRSNTSDIFSPVTHQPALFQGVPLGLLSRPGYILFELSFIATPSEAPIDACAGCSLFPCSTGGGRST